MKDKNRRHKKHGKKPSEQRLMQDFIMSGLIPMLEESADTVTIPREEYNLLVGSMTLLEVVLTMAEGDSADYEIGKFVAMLNKAMSDKGDA